MALIWNCNEKEIEHLRNNPRFYSINDILITENTIGFLISSDELVHIEKIKKKKIK